MSDNQDKPVDFQRPPVVEVMCGASFEKLNAFKASHIGAFWKTLPEQFSLTEELAPVVRPGESIEFSQLPPHPRTWFMTESGQQLVQLQQNLFLYNWKQPDGDDSVEYPEFSNIFPEFLHFLGLFCEFVSNQNLGTIDFHQFELTYLNHVPTRSVKGQVDRYSDVLIDHVRDTSRERFLPEPVNFNWTTSYELPDGLGRLHVQAQSATKKTDEREKLLRLDLTARGVGPDASDAGMKAWFDVAHNMIVNGFADITDQTVQNEIWGRTR